LQVRQSGRRITVRWISGRLWRWEGAWYCLRFRIIY